MKCQKNADRYKDTDSKHEECDTPVHKLSILL